MGFFKKIKNKVQETAQKTSEKVSAVAEKTKKVLKIERLREGLTKTRRNFSDRLKGLLSAGRKIDASLIDEIEEVLITSDIGVKTTTRIIDGVRAKVRKGQHQDAGVLYEMIKEEIQSILVTSPSVEADKAYTTNPDDVPHVIMVVGVNGVGKTTTIGKLARNYREAGKQVLIGAADTFRAAANEQLEVWAQRAEVDIIKQHQGADPASVAYDTLKSAISREAEVVIIDTAGRLHNKVGLMGELEKISRVMQKQRENAPHDTFLVLDATTGQNAIQQAKEFMKATPVTGLILTKLDGTAKGGVVIAIAAEFNIPVRYIGVGEKIEDLQPFEPQKFVDALFEDKEDYEDVEVPVDEDDAVNE